MPAGIISVGRGPTDLNNPIVRIVQNSHLPPSCAELSGLGRWGGGFMQKDLDNRLGCHLMLSFIHGKSHINTSSTLVVAEEVLGVFPTRAHDQPICVRE